MNVAYDPLRADELRKFAKKYIKKRLDEGREDAIEELSAYLADWMHTRERFKHLSAKFKDEEHRQRLANAKKATP